MVIVSEQKIKANGVLHAPILIGNALAAEVP